MNAAGDITKRKKLLKSITLFQNFSEDILNSIAKSLEYCVFIRGDIVIEQGKQGEKLFIIERGSIDVFVMEPGYDPSQHAPTEPGLPVVGRKVMRLSSGDPFGERALMQSKPRAASCVAVENTTCFVLDREMFLQAIESIEIFDGFGYEDRDRADVLALGRHIDKFQRMQTSFEEMRKEHSKADGGSGVNNQLGGGNPKSGSPKTRNSKSMTTPHGAATTTKPSSPNTVRVSAQVESIQANQKKHARKTMTAKGRASIILDTDDDSSEDDYDTHSDEEKDDDHNNETKRNNVMAKGKEDQSTGESVGESIDGGLKLQDGLLHLMSAFSPECDDNDTTERIVKTMYRLCRVERIGMFLCDWKNEQLILSIAREGGARGIRIPMKGIAGHVATTGRVVNVLDASKEPRFDQTMDKKTGFKTKTILAVPIRSHNIIETEGINKG